MIMPCLGARKKPNSHHTASRQPSIIVQDKPFHDKSVLESTRSMTPSRTASITSHLSVIAQIKQEYNDLKSKNQEHVQIITKQAAELDQLRKEISIKSLSVTSFPAATTATATATAVVDPEQIRNKEILLAEKEALLEERNRQIQELVDRLNEEEEKQKNLQIQQQLQHQKQQQQLDNEVYSQLEEKDRLLQEKQNQLEELKLQWESERAELVKPALQQVNTQLEELKETNKIAVDRLTEKENELAELRAQLNRRERQPKISSTKDEDRQKRLNRLTMDLENDRILVQRLDELNQQLETQKQKHETILETHAKAIAEKDHALLQQQKSLKQLKINHENATKTLEQGQVHNLRKLQLQHENDMAELKKRLQKAETQAKSTVDDELDQILVEFEQSQHNHSIQVAHLQQSYKEQISVMKQGQQAELQSLIASKSEKSLQQQQQQQQHQQRQPSVTKLRDSKFQWPPVMA